MTGEGCGVHFITEAFLFFVFFVFEKQLGPSGDEWGDVQEGNYFYLMELLLFNLLVK